MPSNRNQPEPITEQKAKKKAPGAVIVDKVEQDKQHELYELYTPEAYADLIKQNYRELENNQAKFIHITNYFTQTTANVRDFKTYYPHYFVQQSFSSSEECLNQITNESLRENLKDFVKNETEKRENKMVNIILDDFRKHLSHKQSSRNQFDYLKEQLSNLKKDYNQTLYLKLAAALCQKSTVNRLGINQTQTLYNAIINHANAILKQHNTPEPQVIHRLFKPAPTSDKEPTVSSNITEKIKRMLKSK